MSESEPIGLDVSSEKGIVASKGSRERNKMVSEKKTTEHVQELLQLWKHYTTILPVHDETVRNIAAELCSLLVKTNSLDALAVFLEALPTINDYTSNESIVRAKIHVALNKRDTDSVYMLIQNNIFTDGEDLIKVWDEARYIAEEERTSRKLTPLTKFRIRKRHPPPLSICPTGVRKTNSLPRDATSYLKTWLMNHTNDPYPSSREKQQLSKISGLSQAQVKTWFANARRRSKNSEEMRCDIFKDSAPSEGECYEKFADSPSLAPYEDTTVCYAKSQHSCFDTPNHVSPVLYEYLHPIPSHSNYVDHPGYSRYNVENSLINEASPYSSGSFNTVRLCRPSEQLYNGTPFQSSGKFPFHNARCHYEYMRGMSYH